MKAKERRNDEKKAPETWPNMFCCGKDAGPEEMPGCCKSISETHDWNSVMAGCMRVCRWFPLVPVIFGIALLLLGYYLDASMIRVLWIFVAGLIVLLGTLGLILAGRMTKMCCGMK